ncbi:hypothetical protein ABIB25_002488 [Nakamurella sp. UYEF19]|uniref:hypothetical protein n=1 Tax=Nakamurella sp. UYEF19 TaxID=1756392 RepID=UPI0033973A50
MKTTAQLIEAFRQYRERTVTPRVAARDRAVLDRLHAHLDAIGPVLVDETSGEKVSRADGGIGLSDLVDVELIIMNMSSFLADVLAPDDSSSRVTIRQFALWLHRIGELDPCSYLVMNADTRRVGPALPPLRRLDRRV